MNTPQVLDRDGAVLEVGSRVENQDGGGERAWTVKRIEWVGRLGWRILAVANDRPYEHLPPYTRWFGTSPGDKPNTYRCPDLLITKAKENQ